MEAMDNNVTRIGDMAKRTADMAVTKAEAIKDLPQEYNVVTYTDGIRNRVGTVWMNFGTDKPPSILIDADALKKLNGKIRAWFYEKQTGGKGHA